MRDAVVTYVKRLRPEPGDLFVISVDGTVTWEQAERIKDQISGTLPDGCKVLVVESPIAFQGLYGSPMGATIG